MPPPWFTVTIKVVFSNFSLSLLRFCSKGFLCFLLLFALFPSPNIFILFSSFSCSSFQKSSLLPYLRLLFSTGTTLETTVGTCLRILASNIMPLSPCSSTRMRWAVEGIRPHWTGVEKVQPAVCSAKWTIIPSPTVLTVISLQFRKRPLGWDGVIRTHHETDGRQRAVSSCRCVLL